MITDSQIAAFTLPEYLAALNAGHANCRLTEDLSHWTGYGITTAPQLAAYLDRCAAEN